MIHFVFWPLSCEEESQRRSLRLLDHITDEQLATEKQIPLNEGCCTMLHEDHKIKWSKSKWPN